MSLAPRPLAPASVRVPRARCWTLPPRAAREVCSGTWRRRRGRWNRRRRSPPHEAAARVEAWQVDGDARQLYLARRDQVLALARAERHQDARIAASAMSALEDPAWSPALRCEGAQVFAHLAWPDATDTGYSGLLRGLDGATKMGDDRRVAWMRWQLAASATAVGTAEEAVRLGRQAVSALKPLHRPIALGCAGQPAPRCCSLAMTRLPGAGRGLVIAGTHAPGLRAVDSPGAHRGAGRHTERAGRLLAGAGAALRSPVNRDGRAVLARLRHLALDQIGPWKTACRRKLLSMVRKWSNWRGRHWAAESHSNHAGESCSGQGTNAPASRSG